MIIALGSNTKKTYIEDRYFDTYGGDYREYNYPVHSYGRVYPLRIKYYNNPMYDGPPVIFLHGTGTSDVYFWRVEGEVEFFSGFIYAETRDVSGIGLAQGLVDLGYDVVTFTYPDSRHRPLEFQAYDLHRVIEWTKRTFRTKEVNLVGHSMGGLILQYYLATGQARGDNYKFEEPEDEAFRWERTYDVYSYNIEKMKYRDDVDKVVLIATPNLGSLRKGGDYYGSPALFEMIEESDYINFITKGRKEAIRRRQPYPEIYSFIGTGYEDYMGESPLDFGDGIVSVASAEGDFTESKQFKDNIYYFKKDHFEMVLDGGVLSKLDFVLDNHSTTQ